MLLDDFVVYWEYKIYQLLFFYVFQSMKFTYNFSKKDWLAFQKYHLDTSEDIQRTRKTFYWCWWIFIVGAAVATVMSSSIGFNFPMFIVGIVLLYYAYNFKKTNLKNADKILWPDIKRMEWKHELELTDQYCCITEEYKEQKFQREWILDIVLTEEYSFLYTAKLSAFIIPLYQLWDQKSEVVQFLGEIQSKKKPV